jgi:hypothetical protein
LFGNIVKLKRIGEWKKKVLKEGRVRELGHDPP